MKNNSGIDLSELTQAQRKMCVRLLAANNVNFIQNNDNYIATLRVPTQELQNYIVNRKNSKNQQETNSKHCKTKKQFLISDSKSKPKSIQKSKQKQNTFNKIPFGCKKQIIKFKAGKKPLFKSIKLPIIFKIQLLHPEVEVYVYPKKIPLFVLQQQIQQTYELFWQTTRFSIICQFHKCYYDIVCPQNTNLAKAKNDQNLVNSLQTINHFQHKQFGVKIFSLFLSQSYKNQQLSYFLVLRALLEELIGEKILNQKYKLKPMMESHSANKTNSILLNGKQKLKWNPFEKQLSQFICQKFLKIVVAKSNTVDSMFEKLTESMYYCQAKKGNYIKYYDLMDFMLKNFNQQCQDVTTTNLQLSYSNNDSTLNDIIAESVQKSTDRPLQTKFQLSLINESSLNIDEYPQEKQVFNNDLIFAEQAINKAKQICRRLFLPTQTQDQILQKVQQCIKSIIDMDKIKWIEVLGLRGSQQEINFIQQVQIAYKSICKQGQKFVLSNNIIKRIFVGPGFIKLFSRNLSF